MTRHAKPALFAAVFAILCMASLSATAEHLPIKIFTSTDGLGSSFIDYLYRDSRGFMWFCTRDGLSRYDGSQFVTYQIGEPGAVSGIESIFEQSNGTYWVGTTNGFYRFTAETLSQANPAKNGRPLLNADFVGNERGHMYEDHAGKLWFLSDGLFEVAEADGKVAFEKVDLHLPDRLSKGLNFVDNPEDSDGCFWFNAPKGIIRRLPDGRVVFFETDEDSRQNVIIRDRNNLIWSARGREIFIIRPEPLRNLADLGTFTLRRLIPSAEFELRSGAAIAFPQIDGQVFHYTSHEFLEKHIVRRIFESSDGHIWIPTEQNLAEYDGSLLHLYTPAEGFVPAMARVAEDLAGNLWFGGYSGLVRLDRKGLTSYDASDGLASTNILSISEDPDGRLYFATGELSIAELEGSRFLAVRPNLPPGTSVIWTSPFAYRDREGEWWTTTQQGLGRFANIHNFRELDGRSPTAEYNRASGLVNNEAFHVFEDHNGDIWFSQFPARGPNQQLAKLIRATGEVHTFSANEGIPDGSSPVSFAEDGHGDLWLGLYTGGLLRYRNGKFTSFGDQYGVPTAIIPDLHLDRRGRLWIASAIGGLLRIDDTAADVPEFKHFTTEDGLSSNNVRTITEDGFGHLYLGTVRGVDRLSPDTMRVKHYTVSDGLASDFVVDSHCDRRGDVWFATTNGLSRLHPIGDESEPPPQVFLGKLVIAGEEQPIPELGSSSVDRGELSSSQNNFQIDFFGLDFRAGERLRYQYKFESDADWSSPSEQRTVTYAKLSPGSYRFLVRAVDSDGQVSSLPASVNFKILPPLWLRWWFLALIAAIVALIVVVFYRYRIENLRRVNAALEEARSSEERLRLAREERISELESVRTRIATDLHDDIGASLTQISVLSEVAQAQAGKGNGGPPESLRRITEVSNELIGTMSDIVWAINPAKDHLSDLTQRMRRFAADMLSPRGIVVSFDATESDSGLIVKTNARREIFLIFKESINNIARHSESRNVRVELRVAGDIMTLRIDDDGKGFSSTPPTLEDTLSSDGPSGNGLKSMRRRASQLGGHLDIDSAAGGGTTVLLSVPLTGSIDKTIEPNAGDRT